MYTQHYVLTKHIMQ